MSQEVFYFSAKWCGPCQVVGRSVKKLAAESPKIVFRKIDVDEDPELAKEYGVRSLPTLVHLVDDVEVARVIGARTKEDIAKELKL